MKINDNSNMVLRYFFGLDHSEIRFNNLVRFLNETGIHRVVLFSAPFEEASSFFSKEYYRKHSLFLKPYVEKLREMGVEVGINFLFTVGHAYYADEEEFGFRRAVTFDGQPSRGCACMHDKNWLQYTKEVYKYYAELKPSVIYYDDDIRATSLGQITCLCEDHINGVSKRVGRTVTADDIRSSVLSDKFEADDIKTAFFTQMREDIEFIMGEIADAIHEVSPETNIGIMTISYPDMTLDRNLHELFKKLYPKKINGIRTGMNYYREESHKDIPIAFSSPAIQRNIIDDDRIEIEPEIENDIYGYFYNSDASTNMQLCWCLTNGFRNLQLNLFDHIDDVPPNFDEITEFMKEKMPYYNAVCDLIPLGKRADGVNIYASPTALQHKRGKDGQIGFIPEWYKYLSVDGIPIGYDLKNADFLLLTGDDVSGLSDSEIDTLLKKGAVIDLFAAEVLIHRGFGERIGILSEEDVPEKFSGEVFTEDELNGEYKNAHNSHYFYASLYDPSLVKKLNYKEGTRVLSHITNHRKETVCDFLGAYENENGERFLIIPMSHNIFTQFMNITHKRKYQLINVFEWIAKKPLPVYCNNEMVCVNINKFDTYNVITLFNLSSDEIKRPSIFYSPRAELKYLDENGELKPLETAKDGKNIILQKPMKSMEVLVITDGK